MDFSYVIVIIFCIYFYVFNFQVSFYFSGHLYVVVEYCENNNLKGFLSKNSAGFLDEIETFVESMNSDGYLTPRSPIRDDYLTPIHLPAPGPSLPVQKFKVSFEISVFFFFCNLCSVFDISVSYSLDCFLFFAIWLM